MNNPFEDAAPPRLYYGKYKGYVRDNADPEKRGRIRCFVPQVMGDEDDADHWTGWALPNFPWMGGINTLDFGSPLTKEQNNGVEIGVWIEFEGGEPDFPIWTGTWIPAPTPTDPNAQQDLSQAATQNGGSLIDDPPPGSSLDALNPMQPVPNSDETRILVKKGRDIYIGSVKGGGIVLGPSGVHLVGPQVTINGRLMDSDSADKAVG